ncbi:MAG TPA: ComEC/Rec2 family competence protein, partial [Yinghuangia sp.]|nr:ComEC/Rec2 family competence protein [Yinghuangia sp.]
MALVCAAAAAASAAAQAGRAGPVPALAAHAATVTARVTVVGDPSPVAPKVRGTSLGTGAVRVPARIDVLVGVRSVQPFAAQRLRTSVLLLATGREAHAWQHLLPSTRLEATGRLVPAKPGDPTAALFITESAPRVVGDASPYQKWAGHLRARLRDACAGLPAGPRGLLPGLVVGDTGRLPPDLIRDFKTTELTHLLAVSGTNVTILLGAALLAL